MKRRRNLDDAYDEAMQLLASNDLPAALNVLHTSLLTHPRAAQTLYLFGISHLLDDNVDFGLSCVERAYALKPWIRDDLSVIPGAIDKVTSLDPDTPFANSWVEYMRLRLYPLNFGLGYDAVIGTLLRESPVLSFVEVGANDGKIADPIYKYVADGRMRGLLIEPMPEPFEQLQQTYENTTGNTFLNVGVGPVDGELDLFHSELSVLTTANPQKNALKGVENLTKVTVPVRTLGSILDENDMSRFDILQLDTEGYEWEILRDFDLPAYEISVIFVEFYCLSIPERVGMFKKLLDAKYSYYFDGVNMLAVKEDKFPSLCFGHRRGMWSHSPGASAHEG